MPRFDLDGLNVPVDLAPSRKPEDVSKSIAADEISDQLFQQQH